MKALRALQCGLLALLVLTPWLWLLSFAALAAGAALHLGRLPRYANPDPKTVPDIAVLHEVA
jgi:hypothetical protein